MPAATGYSGKAINMVAAAVSAVGGPAATSWAATAGMGAAVGGVGSYLTGGSFTQGAMFGAGAGMGMRYGLRNRDAMVTAANKGMSYFGVAKAADYSTQLSGLMSNFNTVEARRAAVGAGALLGGLTFGGSRSHSRGFNANRGNRIGR